MKAWIFRDHLIRLVKRGFPMVLRRLRPLPVMALLLCGSVSAHAASTYQAGLGPMPLDDETKAVIAGRGLATARYDGKTLTVKGSFKGLPSNATEAHLFQSEYIGVPGRAVLSLRPRQRLLLDDALGPARLPK